MIVIERNDEISELQYFVKPIVDAVNDLLGIRCVLVTDESCISDFLNGDRDRTKDVHFYANLGRKIGLALTPSDNHIIQIAKKLKMKHEQLQLDKGN